MSDERQAASTASNTADAQNAMLDALYQNQEAIEPPSGLDRMIRARAEQALQDDSKARPLPWMGSLATAAVLVLAVAVVIQMPEPAPELPISETTTTRSPAPAPPASLSMPDASDGEAVELDRVKVTGSRARSAESAAAFGDQSASEPAPPARQAMGESAAAPAANRAFDRAEEAHGELQFAPIGEAEDLAESAGPNEIPDWAELKAAIDRGDSELAGTLLERLREAFPEDPRLEEYRARIRGIESEE